MSTTTVENDAPDLPETAAYEPIPARRWALARHSLVMARRSVITMRRNMEQFLDVTIQPVIFVVLFVYLFGGAVSGSTHDYLEFVLPALLVQSMLFLSVPIGVNLNTDIAKGVFDRFRSLPIARSAPLIGAVVADIVRYAISMVVLIGFGTAIGFRAHTNALAVFAGCLVALVFSLSLSWAFVLLAMLVKEPGSVQGIGFMFLFPLTFGSNVFVPTSTMPGWLQSWVHVNPVTKLVESVRGLWLGGPTLEPTLWALGWSALLLVVFFPLAVNAYRRRT